MIVFSVNYGIFINEKVIFFPGFEVYIFSFFWHSLLKDIFLVSLYENRNYLHIIQLIISCHRKICKRKGRNKVYYRDNKRCCSSVTSYKCYPITFRNYANSYRGILSTPPYEDIEMHMHVHKMIDKAKWNNYRWESRRGGRGMNSAIGLLCKTNRNGIGKKTDRGTEIKGERRCGNLWVKNI